MTQFPTESHLRERVPATGGGGRRNEGGSRKVLDERCRIESNEACARGSQELVP